MTRFIIKTKTKIITKVMIKTKDTIIKVTIKIRGIMINSKFLQLKVTFSHKESKLRWKCQMKERKKSSKEKMDRTNWRDMEQSWVHL